MITKFLYQLNSHNKRVITAIVHSSKPQDYDPLREYPMVLDDGYTPLEDEVVSYNYGPHFYAVFIDDKMKYLNLNDYMLKVKLGMTENPAFASPLSKELLTVILEETGYFNSDYDVDYVNSGIYLAKDNQIKDHFDGWFRKVDDDVYVEITGMKRPMFVCKQNDAYCLTDDFKKAFRVSKKECRNLLIANGFIDKDTAKKDLHLSHYNIFMCDNGYAFGGLNSFEVKYSEGVLKIHRGFKMTNEHRLVADKERASLLRDICYLMKNTPDEKKACLRVNGRYVSILDNESYELTGNAAKASLIDLNTIEIIKKAFLLFNSSSSFELVTSKKYYLYRDADSFQLSDDTNEQMNATLITDELYNEYAIAFESSIDDKYIISWDGKYVTYKALPNLTFELKYHNFAYNATRFTEAQIKVLSKLLQINFSKKEISPIFNSNALYNISSTDAFYSLPEAYESFSHMLKNSKINLSDNIEIKYLKTESDKGAMEYLRRFYLKSLYDSYSLFKMVLKNASIKRILLCGTTATAELVSLSQAVEELGRDIDVYTLEVPKWGVYPSAYISPRVTIKGAYRLSFSALDKKFLDNIDMVYFGKNYRDDETSALGEIESLIADNRSVLLVNLGLSKKCDGVNIFNDAVSHILNPAKKLINTDLELLNSLDKEQQSILDKDSTYCSILRIANNKIVDLLKS